MFDNFGEKGHRIKFKKFKFKRREKNFRRINKRRLNEGEVESMNIKNISFRLDVIFEIIQGRNNRGIRM